MAKEKSVSEIIAGALELFQCKGPKGGKTTDHNWTKGAAINYPYANGDPDLSKAQFCALGALSASANGIDNANDHAYRWRGRLREAANLIAESIPKTALRRIGCVTDDPLSVSNIPYWNDEYRTTYRQVKNTFCRALRKAVELESTTKRKSRKVKK